LGEFDLIIEELVDGVNNEYVALHNHQNRWIILSSLFMGLDNNQTNDYHVAIERSLHQIEKKHFTSEGEFELSLISSQYEAIQGILSQHVSTEKRSSPDRSSISDKIDKILLHNVLGFLVFFILMGLVFVFTFEISAPISHGLETIATNSSDFIWKNVSNELLASFLADGLIGGVGFVLVFLPQIAILFLFLSVLEHSGYMARVVFITDRFLHKLGISGKSVAPMLLGFGCNVPAIMASGSISDHNERITVSLVNPFLPCSARFPVFIILSSAIFGEYAGIVVAGLYFSGILIAFSMMFILRKTILKGEVSELLLEMNDLSVPRLNAMFSQVYLQVRKFLENAATWMTLGLIFMWLLSITGPSGYLGPDALSDEQLLQKSWVYIIGDVIQPIFGIFGWDSRIVTALIFGFIAKEIVIGSLGIIYGVGGDLIALEDVLKDEFSPLSAIVFMIFVLAYIPCIGTYFSLRQEIGSKWANFSIVNGLILAWILSFATIIIGGLLI
ncbi:MAG: ferrous iron transport protein B, partial [Candidatus Kariarchaeaceae archaeon]|jgi:ferrous iron transport protein B